MSLELISAALTAVENLLQGIDTRLEAIEKSLERMSERITQIEAPPVIPLEQRRLQRVPDPDHPTMRLH